VMRDARAGRRGWRLEPLAGRRRWGEPGGRERRAAAAVAGRAQLGANREQGGRESGPSFCLAPGKTTTTTTLVKTTTTRDEQPRATTAAAASAIRTAYIRHMPTHN
jgi:hypothetical protein